MEEHFKGFHLVPGSSTGAQILVSPSGVQVASLQTIFGRKVPRVMALVDGVDCGTGHQSVDAMIRYIVRQYERSTSTRWQRIWRATASFFSRRTTIVVTLIAALAGLATILKFLGLSPH